MAKKGRWIKERKEISSYPKTEHQKKIARVGKEIGKECEGKTGEDFWGCRCEILAKHFKNVVCDVNKK